jgi:type IV fimbrial biogenesis protein FimT
MRRSGFTVIELLMVIVIVGVIAGIAFPKLNSAVRNENVRSARRETLTQLSRARAMAVQRGCRAALQMRAATGKVWVEVCKTSGTGRDTVGMISNLPGKYSTTLTTTADSLPFNPNGLGLGLGPITMTFTRGSYTINLDISSVGKPSW